MTLLQQISSVSPLGDAIDGSKPPTPRNPGRPRPSAQPAQLLSPALRAHLAKSGVDLLCVEIISPDQIKIHNRREWRTA